MRFVAFLILSWAVFAQELTIRPTLRQGDTFELEYTRIREDSNRPQTNSRARTPVQVRVLEAAPGGFVLYWQQRGTSFDNPEIVRNPIAAAAANALKDVPLEILLDANGKFAGLRNQAEVAAKLQALHDELLARYAQPLTDAQRKQSVEALIHRLISPEALLSTAAADVHNYFSLHGAKLAKGKPVETHGFRVTVESLDAHEARIATAAGSDSGYYVYNRAFGIMNDVVIVRSVVSSGASRKDTSEIHLVTKPTR